MILKQMSQLSEGSSGLCPAHYGFLPGAMPNYIPTFGGLCLRLPCTKPPHAPLLLPKAKPHTMMEVISVRHL